MWLSGFWSTWQSMRMWMPWNPRVRSGTTSGLLPSSLVGRSSLNFCWSTWTRCWWDFWATNWSYWCSTPCRSLMALESKLLSWNGPLRLTCLESGFDGVVFFFSPNIYGILLGMCFWMCFAIGYISKATKTYRNKDCTWDRRLLHVLALLLLPQLLRTTAMPRMRSDEQPSADGGHLAYWMASWPTAQPGLGISKSLVLLGSSWLKLLESNQLYPLDCSCWLDH